MEFHGPGTIWISCTVLLKGLSKSAICILSLLIHKTTQIATFRDNFWEDQNTLEFSLAKTTESHV